VAWTRRHCTSISPKPRLRSRKGHVADQRDVVEQLERDGHDSTTARDLLVTLLRSQQLHEEHRDRLKRELGVG
jgi:hypothetical protein